MHVDSECSSTSEEPCGLGVICLLGAIRETTLPHRGDEAVTGHSRWVVRRRVTHPHWGGRQVAWVSEVSPEDEV